MKIAWRAIENHAAFPKIVIGQAAVLARKGDGAGGIRPAVWRGRAVGKHRPPVVLVRQAISSLTLAQLTEASMYKYGSFQTKLCALPQPTRNIQKHVDNHQIIMHLPFAKANFPNHLINLKTGGNMPYIEMAAGLIMFSLAIVCLMGLLSIVINAWSFFVSDKNNKKTTPLSRQSVGEKIHDEIYQQLESTYDDAPIDGSILRPSNPFILFMTRIFSFFRLTRKDFKHDDITIKVFRRLLLRHTILSQVEKLSSCHDVNIYLENNFPDGILTNDSLQTHYADKYASDEQNYRHIKHFNLPLWTKKNGNLIITPFTGSTFTTDIALPQSQNPIENKESFTLLPPAIRAYNLAVTDLFVEKALSYLNRKARAYNIFGLVLSVMTLTSIAFGTLTALINTFDDNTYGRFAIYLQENYISKKPIHTSKNDIIDAADNILKLSKSLDDKQSKRNNNDATALNIATEIRTAEKMIRESGDKITQNAANQNQTFILDNYQNFLTKFLTEGNNNFNNSNTIKEYLSLVSLDLKTSRWTNLISNFIKGFTFYGLLVLFSVFSYRMAKALFDQSERLKDRRHALRQGRLFVHLNGGKLSIDELEKAFNWNMSQDNAFANINSEAQAPWGNVVKEMLKTIRETSKAGIKAASKSD